MKISERRLYFFYKIFYNILVKCKIYYIQLYNLKNIYILFEKKFQKYRNYNLSIFYINRFLKVKKLYRITGHSAM